MYDQLRSEYESMKRSAIQPSNSFYPRNDPDLFSANMMDNRDPIRKGILMDVACFYSLSSLKAIPLDSFIDAFKFFWFFSRFMNYFHLVTYFCLNISKTN